MPTKTHDVCVSCWQHYENICEVVKSHISFLCFFKAAPQGAINDAESTTETPIPEFQVTIKTLDKTILQTSLVLEKWSYIYITSTSLTLKLSLPPFLSPTQSQNQIQHVMTSSTTNMTPTHVMTGSCELRRSGPACRVSPHTRWTWPCYGWPTSSET